MVHLKFRYYINTSWLWNCGALILQTSKFFIAYCRFMRLLLTFFAFSSSGGCRSRWCRKKNLWFWWNLQITRRISITTRSTTKTTLTTTPTTTLLPNPLLPTTPSPCPLITWVATPLLWWAKLLWQLTLTTITTKVRLWLTKTTKDTTLLCPTKVHCWTTPHHCTNSPTGLHDWRDPWLG